MDKRFFIAAHMISHLIMPPVDSDVSAMNERGDERQLIGSLLVAVMAWFGREAVGNPNI